ncbi:hypothetical protein U0X36_05330 [Bacillus thuringiensis]|uniref:hypothetical protein n=1 Tax=Bacillus thuringiensis TaxID=1428 RepID=UPI000E540FFE|nr:hypothetical protein [Bacillus thuringiensis]MDZ3952368.1 hypothetical protein [Bacillus thuringiensis]RGP45200.1 hypothetical protein BTW32_25845 [Bacillus thuringiensis]
MEEKLDMLMKIMQEGFVSLNKRLDRLEENLKMVKAEEVVSLREDMMIVKQEVATIRKDTRYLEKKYQQHDKQISELEDQIH